MACDHNMMYVVTVNHGLRIGKALSRREGILVVARHLTPGHQPGVVAHRHTAWSQRLGQVLGAFPALALGVGVVTRGVAIV